MIAQVVRIVPTLTEGFFDGANVGTPLPFEVEVAAHGPISDWPIQGWDGEVTDGQVQFVGKRVILTPKLLCNSDFVVAYILDRDESGGLHELFSGICTSQGLS